MEPDPLASRRTVILKRQQIKKKIAYFAIASVIILPLLTLILTGNIRFQSNVDSDSYEQLTASEPNVSAEIKLVMPQEDEKVFPLEVRKGTTALEALDQVSEQENIEYEYEEDPAFGAVVASVQGKKAEKDQLWVFKVNGEESPVGLSYYELNQRDEITLELQELE
jgi:hypothetical protein